MPLLPKLCPSCLLLSTPQPQPRSPLPLEFLPGLLPGLFASHLSLQPTPHRALGSSLSRAELPLPSPGSPAALKPLSLVSMVLHLIPHAPLWPHVPPFSSTLFQPHQAVGSSTNPSYFLLSLGLCTFHSLYLECFALCPLPWAPAHQHLPVRADWRGRYPSPSDVTDINMGFQGPSPIVTPPGPDDRPEDRSGCEPLTSETFPKPYWLSF